MQSPEAVSAVGKLSYNQLVEKIITCKHSSDTSLVTEGDTPPPLLRLFCRGNGGSSFGLSFLVCLPPPHATRMSAPWKAVWGAVLGD